MNIDILKIIENLGYKVEYNGSLLRIYDKNNNMLTKHCSYDEICKGIDYVSENGQVIHFDNADFMQIKVDDNMTIIVRDIYNEYNDNSISIYFGPNDLTMNFDVCKKGGYGVNGGIFVSVYEDNLTEDSCFVKNIGIVENDHGAIIYIFNQDIRHLSIDECTTGNYLSIILNHLCDIDDKYISKELQKGFDIIAPCFIGMIEDFVNSREGNIKKKL